MTKNNTPVFFEIMDFEAVRKYCTAANIETPREYNTEGARDYYKSTFEVWSRLYWNLPYIVTGCYII